MAKYNAKTNIQSSIVNRPDATRNFEGGIAFKMDAKTELFTRAATCLVSEPKFYESGRSSDNKIKELVQKVAKEDPEFILKLALYCRKNLYLRSAPLMLITEFANSEGIGKVPNARKYVAETLARADEIKELIACQVNRDKLASRKRKIPNVVKNGIADAFNKFDEYQFAKYTRNEIEEVKFRDALLICHPKPKDDNQSELFKKILGNTLATPDTWEAYTQIHGRTKESWEAILPNMGYMGILRNLVYFLQTGVDTEKYLKHLTDDYAISKSKQFPFRFYTSYRIVSGTPKDKIKKPYDGPKVRKALNEAIEKSIKNVPRLEGNTFTAVDVSGSMDAPITAKSSVSRKETALVFGSIMNHLSNNSLIGVFGTDFEIVPVMEGFGIIPTVEMASEIDVDHSTDAWKAVKYLNDNKIDVDRIVVISDMQCYNSSGYNNSLYSEIVKYKRSINPDVYMYSIDVGGYGTSNIPQNEKNTAILAGWSDKILNFIDLFEKDRATMVGEVEKISPMGV